MTGIAINLIKCTLSNMGQPYQITMTSWSDAQLRVQSGQPHGFFIATQTAERDQYATLSNTITEQKLRWYFAQGVKPNLDSISKINLQFSAKFGSNKWFWLKRNGFNVVKQPRDAKVLLKLLKQREIDVVLEDENIFSSQLKEAALPSDYFQTVALESRPMGIYFSNRFLAQYSGFLDAFNAALKVCR